MGNSQVPEKPASKTAIVLLVSAVVAFIAFAANASGLISDLIEISRAVSPPKAEPMPAPPDPAVDQEALNARQAAEQQQQELLQTLIAAVRALEKEKAETRRSLPLADHSPAPAPSQATEPFRPFIHVSRLDDVVVGVSRGKGAGGRRELSLSSTPVKIDVLPQVRLGNLTARWLIEGSPPIDAGQFSKPASASTIVIKRYPMPEVNQSHSGVLEIRYEDAQRITYTERLPFAVSRCPDHIHLILDSPSAGHSELFTN